MASIFDVAKYILEKKGPMSSWKLQKLCYYCQAWHYTWTDSPLFPERFEAWMNGPVCPVLYRVHQGMFMLHTEDIPGNPDSLSEDEKESVDIILHDYGDAKPFELVSQTHAEAPWKDARQGLADLEPSHNEITLESMGAYYGSL